MLMEFPLVWYIVGFYRSKIGWFFWIWIRKYFQIENWWIYSILQLPFFLRFLLYLLQFFTHKELLYTNFKQMLWEFCRTLQFFDNCFRERITASEASPLFSAHPLVRAVKNRGVWPPCPLYRVWCHFYYITLFSMYLRFWLLPPPLQPYLLHGSSLVGFTIFIAFKTTKVELSY